MNLSTEAKVGLASIVGVAILVWMMLWVGHFNFQDKGYDIEAVFHQVDGLVEGNPVSYAGVNVGKVAQVIVTPQGVNVKLRIRPDVQIPEGSNISVASTGLIGEKYIEIIPNPNGQRFLVNGDTVEGIDPQRMFDVLATIEQTAKDMQKLINNINDIVGNEQSKTALKQTILNLQAATGNLEALSASLQRMATNSEQDVLTTVSNLRGISERLLSAAEQTDIFMKQFAADGKTGQELKQTIESIDRTAQKVEKMATALEKEVTDPQTAQSLKTTLQNVRSVSEKANQMLAKVQNVKTDGGAEVLAGKDAYQTNMDLRIHNGGSFVQVGVNDIGEGNKANLQIGKQTGHLTGRMGIFDGKAGIGLDNNLGNRAKVTLELIDPNDLRIKLRGQYLIGNNSILVENPDIKNSQQTTYIGVRTSF